MVEYVNGRAGPEAVYCRRAGWCARELCGESLVLPVGSAEINARQVAVLSGSGGFLWERLERPATRRELIEAMLEEYDATPEQVAADIDEFLSELVKYNYIEITEKTEETK